MRRILCLCNICFNIRGLFGKAGFIPILNNWFDEKSKMKTVVEDRKSSHRLGDYWWSCLGCTPKMRESVGGRPDVLGDGWICEESASGFVQTQNELVNGLCVWHWILFCLIDFIKYISVWRELPVWHAKMQWSGLLLKSKVLWWWSKHDLHGSFVYSIDSRASHLGMS